MRVEELATGPLPMVTNPGRLAKALEAAAGAMMQPEGIGVTAKAK